MIYYSILFAEQKQLCQNYCTYADYFEVFLVVVDFVALLAVFLAVALAEDLRVFVELAADFVVDLAVDFAAVDLLVEDFRVVAWRVVLLLVALRAKRPRRAGFSSSIFLASSRVIFFGS